MELAFALGMADASWSPELAALLPLVAPTDVRLLGARDAESLRAEGVASLRDRVTLVDGERLTADPAGSAAAACTRFPAVVVPSRPRCAVDGGASCDRLPAARGPRLGGAHAGRNHSPERRPSWLGCHHLQSRPRSHTCPRATDRPIHRIRDRAGIRSRGLLSHSARKASRARSSSSITRSGVAGLFLRVVDQVELAGRSALGVRRAAASARCSRGSRREPASAKRAPPGGRTRRSRPSRSAARHRQPPTRVPTFAQLIDRRQQVEFGLGDSPVSWNPWRQRCDATQVVDEDGAQAPSPTTSVRIHTAGSRPSSTPAPAGTPTGHRRRGSGSRLVHQWRLPVLSPSARSFMRRPAGCSG